MRTRRRWSAGLRNPYARRAPSEVFRHLVLARIIEPTSKLDSLRVLEEAGVPSASYRTLKRRLPAYAQEQWRQRLSEACAAPARLGPAIEKFMAARRLPDVTVVADAGMISDANRTAIKAAGLSAAYAVLGVGTIREAMITVDELLAYQDAAEQRLLSLRVRPPIQASTATP